MTPSPNRDNKIEPLPPALSSMWRLCKLGYRHEPRLMLSAFVLSQLAALPDALLALWLMLLGKGVLEHNPGLVEGAAVGLAVSTAATWFLRTVSTRVQRRFRDKVTIALESHVAQLQASVATIAHQERPEYLDRISMLRNQIFVLDHMYMSLFSTVGWILRLGVTMALLASIHPALLLLVVFAVPTVWPQRGGQTWSAPPKNVERKADGWLVTFRRRYDRIAREGSARPRHRRTARRRSSVGMATLVCASGPCQMGLSAVVRAGVADIWTGICRSCCLRLFRDSRACEFGVTCARRGRSSLRIHWRHCGRDWISTRILDGRLAASRMAGGLHRFRGGTGRFAGSRQFAPRNTT